jgi:tripartite-type tricarboxylate transporter receptor subunit TctC
MQNPEVKAAYESKGIKATPMSPQEFAKFVREEMAKYQKIAKDANIEPQ